MSTLYDLSTKGSTSDLSTMGSYYKTSRDAPAKDFPLLSNLQAFKFRHGYFPRIFLLKKNLGVQNCPNLSIAIYV